jgi:hypothetical protein
MPMYIWLVSLIQQEQSICHGRKSQVLQEALALIVQLSGQARKRKTPTTEPLNYTMLPAEPGIYT